MSVNAAAVLSLSRAGHAGCGQRVEVGPQVDRVWANSWAGRGPPGSLSVCLLGEELAGCPLPSSLPSQLFPSRVLSTGCSFVFQTPPTLFCCSQGGRAGWWLVQAGVSSPSVLPKDLDPGMR